MIDSRRMFWRATLVNRFFLFFFLFKETGVTVAMTKRNIGRVAKYSDADFTLASTHLTERFNNRELDFQNSPSMTKRVV